MAELKSAGVPVSAARLRECFNRWTNGGRKIIKRRGAKRITALTHATSSESKMDAIKVQPVTVSQNLAWRNSQRSRAGILTTHPLGGRSRAGCWHGALRNRQAPCQQPACFAESNMRRFVTPTVPPTGADAQRFLLGVRSERRAARRHQPDRKTIFAPVACRWAVRSMPRRTSQVCRLRKTRRLLGWNRWLVGAVSEPLLPRCTFERRSLSS